MDEGMVGSRVYLLTYTAMCTGPAVKPTVDQTVAVLERML